MRGDVREPAPRPAVEMVNVSAIADALTLLALRHDPYPSPGVTRALKKVKRRILEREGE